MRFVVVLKKAQKEGRKVVGGLEVVCRNCIAELISEVIMESQSVTSRYQVFMDKRNPALGSSESRCEFSKYF
jgi:hypothetical protein